MNEVLMFNPNDLSYMYLSASSKNDMDKLKENGWVANPKLIDMYHEGLKKHAMVPIQDQKMWEVKGYYAEPTMIYSPKEDTRMVSAADAKKAIQNGWYLSPAHFPGNSEGKIKTLTLKEAV